MNPAFFRQLTIGSALTAALLLSAGCRNSEASEAAAETGPKVSGDQIHFDGSSAQEGIELTPVTQAQAAQLQLPGRLVWDEDHTVRVYTPFSGRIARIEADLGAKVSAGQSLALISSPDFGQAQADERKATVDFAISKKNLERQNDLFVHGVAAEKDLEQAQGDFMHAKAELERAEAVMKVFGAPVDAVDQQFTLKSPIAGTVVERSLNPGQELRADQPATPLFVVTDTRELWLQLDANEADLSKLAVGQTLALSSALYPGETFKATVSKIADYVDPVTRTIKVRGSVHNDDHRLKGEMFVTASLQTVASSLPSVPASSVYLYSNRQYVFASADGKSFSRREVSTAAGGAAGQTLIAQGIKPGERVVSRGALYLQQMLDNAKG